VVSLNFSTSTAPHLLIGGTTGSGKSEALNTILHGMTRFYSADELKLKLIDPKSTELVPFEDCEHLIGEIESDAESAITLLEEAVDEMQARYGTFKGNKVKSLSQYNKAVAADERLPWWVIVLDEYADLTTEKADKAEIEKLLKRLAQKARAAGIHVIIATQKPSAEVISTNLRSNLPAQLALRVKSSTESRVIMDDSGAETLNGKGDAFLKTVEGLERIQCALVNDQ
ncbi:FtsK/SpoIIIE domain-containing protein, partial [Akkermansiaceae bacterium]|nr:FtsK/SpoIIIE domain-containing protein [Akkermansiaceae bacterium]